MKPGKDIVVITLAGLLVSGYSSAQIYQGGGVVVGKIASSEICADATPLVHDSKLELKKKNTDSCKGSLDAKCKVNFDGEETVWRGPDTAIRTIDLSCYYTNADYSNNDGSTCASKADFSTIEYNSLIILPKFAKPYWNLSLDITYSGDNFLSEVVFVRVEMANDTDQSKEVTSLILPCDDQHTFSGDSPGEIVDMTPGEYRLKISQPDYAALYDKAHSQMHKDGKLYIKYQVMLTGHD